MHGEDKFYPMSQTKIADDHFAIAVPNGSMEGDLSRMHVTASMVWCVEIAKLSRAWATVLHADGRQEVVEVTPFSKYPAKRWKNPASGQNYPIDFTVNIPKLNANLQVAPYPSEQEIASDHISKYEAASQVKGTYQGKPATGFCYVELVGGFR